MEIGLMWLFAIAGALLGGFWGYNSLGDTLFEATILVIIAMTVTLVILLLINITELFGVPHLILTIYSLIMLATMMLGVGVVYLIDILDDWNTQRRFERKQ